MRYHLKSDGNPGKCTAEKGKCPFGSENPHFSSEATARAFYEKKQTSSFLTIDHMTGISTFNKNQFNFDYEVVEAFTEGDCWRLAFSLHKKLGYQVFVITDEESTNREDMYFGHMVVRNPSSGLFIDVNGEHTDEDLLSCDWGIDGKYILADVSDDLNIRQASVPFYKHISSDSTAEEIIKTLAL